MRKKNYKGRCEKISLRKCEGVCKSYSSIQTSFAVSLEDNDDVNSFRCNVPLNGDGVDYTTDFLCTKKDGTQMVRECVLRRHVSKPLTVKQLDISLKYWREHGITDWGVVVEKE